ncbi:serine carboxypeptidase-like 42 [Cucumis melo var. makuwa]|uniref:Serine carboxypeptidase-like 42 n=1 Tax=Cucumis melo var. makuwa TaxID=1194695 RepID=A0A5A7UUV0_CUCMM|nr:serine carboxypeptidase-like 42 [Cucumis melo var. makuwa]TYK23729.1 serine carboxypeptidase-like 42 [Cucumis melo var. makuwa]
MSLINPSESLEEWQSSGNEGAFLKLDLDKAYDKLHCHSRSMMDFQQGCSTHEAAEQSIEARLLWLPKLAEKRILLSGRFFNQMRLSSNVGGSEQHPGVALVSGVPTSEESFRLGSKGKGAGAFDEKRIVGLRLSEGEE